MKLSEPLEDYEPLSEPLGNHKVREEESYSQPNEPLGESLSVTPNEPLSESPSVAPSEPNEPLSVTPNEPLGEPLSVAPSEPNEPLGESPSVAPSEPNEPLGESPSDFRSSQRSYPQSSETLDVPSGALATSSLLGAPLKYRGDSSSPEVDKQRAKRRNKTSDTQVAKSTALDAYTYYKGSVYTTDEIELAMLDLRADLVPLKEALQGFLIKNHKYLSVSEMSQLLGITPKTVLKVLPSKYHDSINTFRTQTVIIWSKSETKG